MSKNSVKVNFRVTPAEKKAAETKAAAQGRTLSNYLANLVRGDLKKEVKGNG